MIDYWQEKSDLTEDVLSNGLCEETSSLIYIF